MKLSMVVVLLSAAAAIASPAAVSINRSMRDVVDENGNVAQVACVECPCDGWFGPCRCVHNGCCRNHCK